MQRPTPEAGSNSLVRRMIKTKNVLLQAFGCAADHSTLSISWAAAIIPAAFFLTFGFDAHSFVSPRETTAESCAALSGLSLAPLEITLATGGARVTSADLEILEGNRTICVVKGAIAPVDARAPNIHFQVNLPSNWNGRAVHVGGGGYNGALVSGRIMLYLPGPPPSDAKKIPLPTADIVPLGYVTFGSDSGHQWDPTRPDEMAAFALNAEALDNFAGAQLKKTHDVALRVIRQYYGKPPRRMYFYGSSQGGHEALTVIQRWPADYDGVVAIHPAYNFTALQLGGLAVAQRLYQSPETWLSPEKSAVIANAALEACDSLDGLSDDIISDVAACRKAFDVSMLICGSRKHEASDCLSKEQVETARLISRGTWFGFSLSGMTNFSGWPILEGAPAATFGFGTQPLPSRPRQPTGAGLMADQLVRYMVMADPAYDFLAFKPSEHVVTLQRLSQALDASSPNLDAFRRRGGKLLLMHGSTDMAIPPGNSVAYYEMLREQYGASLKTFARFYIAPGFGHASGPFFVEWNSLETLDRWVDGGESPRRQVVKDLAPEHKGRYRPLCEYPAWPKYRGSGDTNSANRFTCVTS